VIFQHIHTLLVDDDEIEIEAVRRAYLQQQFNSPVIAVHDGLEALKVLRGQDGHLPIPRPYFVLLDLYMPHMNGIEFLQKLRQDLELRRTLVFVFTNSKREQDIKAAYGYGVAGYIVKEKAGQHYQDMIKLLATYLTTVALPLPNRFA